MFNANLRIISDLKEFLTFVIKDRSILNIFSVSEKAFSRSRKLPFEKLVLLISKLCKKTLSVELEDFYKEVGSFSCCSVSAFSQQRLKLKASFFYFWNVFLCKSYYENYEKSVLRWKDYRIIAVDGSTISLINNPGLSEYFGGQNNQNCDFVLARTLYHYDVLNEIILHPQIGPFQYGELSMAYDAIDNIEEDMITIYDRNFSNYKMIALHLWQEKEKKFVIRAKESQKIIRTFIASGKYSSIVDIPPTPSAIIGLKKCGFIVSKNTFLKVRLVRVDLQNSVEVLITNLWETEEHPTEQFKDLYFMRWGIETNISIQKNILQLESFSGQTVQSVLQDFFATIMMTNLNAILIKDAQNTIENNCKHMKYPMKVNKNKSYGKLKTNLVSLFLDNDIEQILNKLHEHFVKEKVPIRKGRSFERIIKNRQSKSKHKTFTNYKPSF